MHSALFPPPGLSVTVRPASHQAREHPNPPVERPCTTHGPYHHRDTKTLQSRCRICLCLKAKSRSHDAQSHTLHGGDANTAQVQADWRRIKSLGGSSKKLNPSRPKRQPFLRIFNDSQYITLFCSLQFAVCSLAVGLVLNANYGSGLLISRSCRCLCLPL